MGLKRGLFGIFELVFRQKFVKIESKIPKIAIFARFLPQNCYKMPKKPYRKFIFSKLGQILTFFGSKMVENLDF